MLQLIAVSRVAILARGWASGFYNACIEPNHPDWHVQSNASRKRNRQPCTHSPQPRIVFSNSEIDGLAIAHSSQVVGATAWHAVVSVDGALCIWRYYAWIFGL